MPESQADVVSAARDLRISIGRVARRLRQLSTQAAGADLLFLELAVLSRLDRYGPATPTALANNERVTGQAIGPIVTSLLRRGLVSRTPDPRDGRKAVVALTEVGRRALSAQEHGVTDRISRALQEGFSPQQIEQLAAITPLLDRLASTL